jgi:hypothetical protein
VEGACGPAKLKNDQSHVRERRTWSIRMERQLSGRPGAEDERLKQKQGDERRGHDEIASHLFLWFIFCLLRNLGRRRLGVGVFFLFFFSCLVFAVT